MLLAGSWFVGYAFANDWIGEKSRIGICFGLGAAIYLWGVTMLKKQPGRGQMLVILGFAITLLALFSGHQLYGILPSSYIFATMFGMTVITAAIAIVGDYAAMGFTSVFTAMIIPLLITTENPNLLFLINYVLLVDAAALLMFLLRGWGWTFHVAWLATLAFSYAFFHLEEHIAYAYIAIFSLLFFIPAGLKACESIHQRLPLKGAFLLLTVMIALILWIENDILSNWYIVFYLVAAALTLFFCHAMSLKWDKIHKETPTLKYTLAYILGFSVMAYIFVLTARVATPDYLAIIYLLEAVIATSVGVFVFQSALAGASLALYLLLPLEFVLSQLFGPQRTLYAELHSLDFANLCVATISLALTSWMVYPHRDQENSSSFQQKISGCLIVFTGILVMCLIWNLCHNLISSPNIARGLALVIYVLAAEYLIYLGNLNGLKKLRLGGIVVIVYVIGRLLFVEVWTMPVVIRMITFVITGLLLIGTAWFDKRSKKAL